MNQLGEEVKRQLVGVTYHDGGRTVDAKLARRSAYVVALSLGCATGSGSIDSWRSRAYSPG